VIIVAKGVYHFIGEVWKNPKKKMKSLYRERLIQWRDESGFQVLDKPTRLDKARALGYKDKKGVIVVRGRIRRGGRRRPLFGRRGRKPAKSGLTGFTPKKSRQWIIEERANKKFPNLEVLSSYKVGEDGSHEWFEVIMVDPRRPEIQKDKNLGWVADKNQRRRAMRGLTTSGKRSREL
jgi:large subunit ribosomal protein L15e